MRPTAADHPALGPASVGQSSAEVEAKLEAQREHFNSIADRYAAARRGANHLLLKELMWRHFFARNPLPRGRRLRVLEAMCGYADGEAILRDYAGAEVEYHGFDYSDRVVETLKAQRPELDVWQADATKYKPQPGAYDVIMLLGALHHVPDAAIDVAASLAAGLARGGVLINLEPTHGNPLTKAIRDRVYRKNSLFDEGTERAFGVGELEGLFQRAGLERRDIVHPGLLSYVLYYNPDAFPGLNLGGRRAVRAAYAVDRPMVGTVIGRWLAFATLSMWVRPA